MLRKIVFAGAFAGLAASFPAFYEANPELVARFFRPAAAPPLAASVTPDAPAPAALSGRRIRIPADARGHFSADFRINGRPVPALVDTGATVVAVNLSTARRIGLTLSASDFTIPVETANGRARAAPATLSRLEIGGIELRDVQAVVLEDRALAGTLVGMSFLSRLKRYQVENGELMLEQ